MKSWIPYAAGAVLLIFCFVLLNKWDPSSSRPVDQSDPDDQWEEEVEESSVGRFTPEMIEQVERQRARSTRDDDSSTTRDPIAPNETETSGNTSQLIRRDAPGTLINTGDGRLATTNSVGGTPGAPGVPSVNTGNTTGSDTSLSRPGMGQGSTSPTLGTADSGIENSAGSGQSVSDWRSRITGTVVDENDTPVGEALIIVADQSTGMGRTLSSAQTDFNGAFGFIDVHRSSLRPDECRALLTVNAIGHAAATRSVVLTPTRPEAVVNFRLSGEEGVSLSGRVVKSDGGGYVSGGEVIAYAPGQSTILSKATTNSQGGFTLNSLPRGEVNLSVAPRGGVHQDGGRHTAPNQNVTITLREPNGIVRGQVVGAISETPMGNVTVWLGDEVAGQNAFETVTDGSGQFEFTDLPRESWTVSVPNAVTDLPTVNLRTQREVEITVQIAEPVIVAGVIKSRHNSQPVGGVEIELDVDGRPRTTTDGNGAFSFGEVPVLLDSLNDSQEVSLQRVEFRIYSRTAPWVFSEPVVSERPGDLGDLDLWVERGRNLEVTVVDPNGNPISQAEIGLRPGAGPSIEWASDVTDQDGKITISQTDVHPQDTVVGTHPDWKFILTEHIPESATSITAYAMPYRDIEVQVMQGGEPYRGAQVLMSYLPMPTIPIPYELIVRSGLPRLTTNAEGRVVFSKIPQVPVQIHAQVFDSQAGAVVLKSDPEEIEPAGPDGEVTLVMIAPDAITVTGRLVDHLDGPLGGIRLYAISDIQAGRDDSPLATSNSEGHFTVEASPTQIGAGIIPRSTTHVIATEGDAALDSVVRRADGGDAGDVVMVPNVNVSGSVQRDGGTSADNVRIVPWRPELNHDRGNWSSFSRVGPWPATLPNQLFVTDSTGRFSGSLGSQPEIVFDAAPTQFMFVAIDTTAQQCGATFIQVPFGLTVPAMTVPTMVMEGYHEIQVRVINSGGSPVNATVNWENYHPTHHLTGVRWSVDTDSNGEATLSPIPRGDWKISVTSGNTVQSFDVHVPTQEGVITLQLN